MSAHPDLNGGICLFHAKNIIAPVEDGVHPPLAKLAKMWNSMDAEKKIREWNAACRAHPAEKKAKSTADPSHLRVLRKLRKSQEKGLVTESQKKAIQRKIKKIEEDKSLTDTQKKSHIRKLIPN
jgi:fatty-acid desaturase